MPWPKENRNDAILAFVASAMAPNANIAALCRSARVSRKSAYLWINRAEKLGFVELRRSLAPKVKIRKARNRHPEFTEEERKRLDAVISHKGAATEQQRKNVRILYAMSSPRARMADVASSIRVPRRHVYDVLSAWARVRLDAIDTPMRRIGRPRVDPLVEKQVRALKLSKSQREIASALNLSLGVVNKILRRSDSRP